LHDTSGGTSASLIVDSDANGELSLRDGDSVEKARLALLPATDSGNLVLRGQRGWPIVSGEELAPAAPNHGAVRVYGAAAQGGGSNLLGEIVADSTTQGGILTLFDAAGTPTIVLDGATGVITKVGLNGFLIAHPKNAQQEILYASLEGPEAGIYTRGTARLQNGRAVVRLPEHFAAVARPGSLTVQLTPHVTNTRGLAILEKAVDAITVGELGNGRGTFAFDFVVNAERGDVARIEPVRQRNVIGAAQRTNVDQLGNDAQVVIVRPVGELAPDPLPPSQDRATSDKEPADSLKSAADIPDLAEPAAEDAEAGVRRVDVREGEEKTDDVATDPELRRPE
jgi:hypothetical protein